MKLISHQTQLHYEFVLKITLVLYRENILHSIKLILKLLKRHKVCPFIPKGHLEILNQGKHFIFLIIQTS